MGEEMGVSLYGGRKKWLEKADLTSDMFAAVVFEDYLALQDVLRILTGIADLKVTRVVPQKTIRNLYGHASVLDVWAEDSRGHQFNIELQMSENEEHLKRNRYIQSQIDTRIFGKGKEYEEIPDLYLIFITKKDFLHVHTGITEVIRVISKNNQRVDNGVHEIYANLEYPAERDDVARLLDFVKNTNRLDVDTRGFEHLANRVYELKNEGEGVSQMCEWSEWERSEGRKEGRKEGWIESQIECVLEILEEYGTVPDGLRQMIESQKDINILRDWMKAAIKSHSVEEFEEKVSLVVK